MQFQSVCQEPLSAGILNGCDRIDFRCHYGGNFLMFRSKRLFQCC